MLILHKPSRSLYILNDMLGRLPVYYFQCVNKLILSRELRFIEALNGRRDIDRMAIAQYLLFRYPLGNRTLLEGVNRLQPCSLVFVDCKHKKIVISRYHVPNLEIKPNSCRSIPENASRLISLFSESCWTRANQADQCLLGLSGGLDSRSVAACMRKYGGRIRAVTRENWNSGNAHDVLIAERVANVLGIEHIVDKIGSPTGRDMTALLQMKGGLNYLGVAFMVPFLENIRDSYGQTITYMTGDGEIRFSSISVLLIKLAH